jgi:ABC-type sugar transport system permease subunit
MTTTLQRWGGYLFVLPYLVLFAVFVLMPVVFGLVLSFMNWEMSSTVPPTFAGASNYTHAMTDPYFWKAMRATLFFVVLSVPLTVVVALLLGLAMAAVNRRRAFYRGAILLPMMINISVAGILWRWLFNSDFGVLNVYLSQLTGLKIPWLSSPMWAMPSIAIMTLWWTVGGPSILLLAGLQQIPQQYYEAGEIDGAVGFRRFWHITLPLVRPVLLFVIVMNIIGGFQVFGQTFMITHGGPELSTRVLMQYVYETSFNNYHMGYGAAMSWLLFVLIALVSYAQYRTMREKA